MKSVAGSPFSEGKSALTSMPLSTCSAMVSVRSAVDVADPLVPVIVIG